MIDCLLIGYNDTPFDRHVDTVRRIGTDSVSYRDLRLGFVDYDGKPYRALDLLTHVRASQGGPPEKPYHNADVLWPVISYLGTYLHRRGYSFDYVNLFQHEKAALAEKLRKNEYRAIVITTTIYIAAQPILEVLSFVREHNNKAKIIIGGPYISKQKEALDAASLESLFEYFGADFYVTSREGETALVRILASLKTGAAPDLIENIAFRRNGRYVSTLPASETNSLEAEMIDYGLFPRERIGSVVALRTAKSCPFACSFCGFPLRADRYTVMSVEAVEKELNTLRDIGGVGTVNFLDDTFNVPKERFVGILRMMIRNRYGFKWHSFYRCDHGGPEVIELMKEAGCEGVFLGIESPNDEMLKRMNKTATRRRYEEALPLLHQAGISTFVSLIFGFPGETSETVRESIEFIEDFQPDFWRPQVWWCDPVTPIFQQRAKYGIEGQGYGWTHDTMDAATACEVFERSFLAVRNSVWVPEPGFNPYSMYYLTQRGMSLPQVKIFLTAFNNCVKSQIIHPGKELDPETRANLIAACCYDFQPSGREKPIEVLSADAYLAAEKYWTGEISQGDYSGFLGSGSVAVSAPSFVVESSRLERIAADCGVEETEVLLAAYALLVGRISGRKQVAILVTANFETAVPVFVALPADFGALARAVAEKLHTGRRHAAYALYLLTSESRIRQHGRACPVFDAGFAFPGAASSCGLTLSMLPARGGYALKIGCPEQWGWQAKRWSQELQTLLEEVETELLPPDENPVLDRLASESFSF